MKGLIVVLCATVAALAVLRLATAAVADVGPPQGIQSDGSFAASYAGAGVTNVSATTQRTSC